MLTSSAKAKGRKASTMVKDLLFKYAPDLRQGDIEVTPSGVTGVDLKLSPAAKEIYPFAIEVKNQESLNIWSAYEQAMKHSAGTTDMPILFFKRNKSELMACLKADDFIKLIR
jgi:hypothetical protein